MLGATPEAAGALPVARCARCGRDVLTHVHLDAREGEVRLCLHCDATIDPSAVRWADAAEAATLGYALEDADAGGCGRPGCGRGNCANRR